MPREAVKQRIIAIVRHAGEISGNDLFDMIYVNHRNVPSRHVLKAHIWQLRKAGYPIRAFGWHRNHYKWGGEV